MNENTEKLLASLKRIRLTDEERFAMHGRLSGLLKRSPVTFSSPGRLHKAKGASPILSPFTNLLAAFRRNHRAPIALGLILMLSAGSGVALAAERAVPGDILYPVKVNVDEKVAAAFAVSTEAKANLATRLADRRLDEAAELSSRSGLSTRTRTELKERLAGHLNDTKKHVAKLRSKGRSREAREIETELKSSLGAHPDILLYLDISVSFEDVDNDLDLSDDEDEVHRSRGESDLNATSISSEAVSERREGRDSDDSSDDDAFVNSGPRGGRHSGDDADGSLRKRGGRSKDRNDDDSGHIRINF